MTGRFDRKFRFAAKKKIMLVEIRKIGANPNSTEHNLFIEYLSGSQDSLPPKP
jgi:hypothetical protein